MMKRALFVGMLGIAWLMGGETEVSACTPPEGAPDGTLVRMNFQGPNFTSPKNVGLILRAFAGLNTGESGVIAQAQIEVKNVASGTVVPGSLRRLETTDSTAAESSIWSWKPDGAEALTPGVYRATINLTKAPSGSEPTAFNFTIEDRVLNVPRIETTSMQTTRFLEPDSTSPAITCKIQRAIGGCSDTLPPGDDLTAIPSRQRGAPELRWTGMEPEVGASAFVRMKAHIFARTSSGIIVKEEERSWLSVSGSATLAPADEYCVEVTSWILTDPTNTQVTQKCTPHGSLDLAVSDAEQTTYAERAVEACSKDAPIVFPPGHTKDDPAGVGTAAASNDPASSSFARAESGCACTVPPNQPSNMRSGVLAAIGALATLITLKRRRR